MTHPTGHQATNYTTSLIGNKTIEWLKLVKDQPFFAYLGPHAPHLPATPAEWYKHHPVGTIPAPKDTPYYNYKALDHHRPICDQKHLTKEVEHKIDEEYGNRLRTLVSVDDIVVALKEYLVSVGKWDNTYVFFTSDHGYS